MSQEHYNQHYDATAAKGLCWECKTNRARKEWVRLHGGTSVLVESLWCLDCGLKFIVDVDATDKDAA